MVITRASSGGGSGSSETISSAEKSFNNSSAIDTVTATLSQSGKELSIEWMINSASVEELEDTVQPTGNIAAFTGPDIPDDFAEGLSDTFPVEVSIRPRSIDKIDGAISSAISEISNAGGVEASIIKREIQNKTPNASFGSLSSNLSMDYNIERVSQTTDVTLGTSTPDDVSIDFTPVRIPTPDDVNLAEVLSKDVGATISIEFSTDGVSRKDTSGTIATTSGQTTLEINLPPSILVEETDLSVDCSKKYGDIDSAVNKLESDISSAISGASEAKNTLESQVSELADAAGESYTSEDIPQSVPTEQIDDQTSADGAISTIEDIKDSTIREIDLSAIRRIRDRVDSANPHDQEVSDIQSRMDDLESEIKSDVDEECLGEFNEQMDSVQTQFGILEDLTSNTRELKDVLLDKLKINGKTNGKIDCEELFSEISSSITNIRDDVSSLLSDVRGDTGDIQERVDDITSQISQLRSDVDSVRSKIKSTVDSDHPCRSEFISRLEEVESDISDIENRIQDETKLTCEDISKSIRSAVTAFEGTADEFIGLKLSKRKPERRSELISRGNDLISRIQENAKDENPCKSKLLSRVRSSVSELERSDTIDREEIPCSERFSSVDSKIDDFEDRVLSIKDSPRPETVQDIAKEGQTLINRIESEVPNDSGCRQEMVQRVRSLTERVESLRSEVRVKTSDISDAASERSDQLQGLLENIQGMQLNQNNRNRTDEDLDTQLT